MKRIGDTVSAKDIRRAMFAFNGHVAYFDDGIDITGQVKQVAHFLERRLLVEFEHANRKYHVNVPETDVV